MIIKNKRLKDKTIIISGGAAGIGKASAELFAAHGARVAICDINKQEGRDTAKIIATDGGVCEFFKVDVTDEENIKRTVAEILEKFGNIDGLFNNAGIDFISPVTDTGCEDWNMVMNVNLRGMFLLTKHVVTVMKKQESGGVILNTSSIGGLTGWSNYSAYCSSKGGVIALTKQLAVELADDGIRVNCICPGSTLTQMVERIISKEENPEKVRAQIAAMHPLGRFAKPEEIAAAALFCISSDSSFCTGMVLPVDGGMTSV
jgi:dihydroanticapsin dehydrogenase